MKMKRKVELPVLLVYPAVASVVSFICNANMFFSVLIFFGAPAAYLSVRSRKDVLKTFLFSLIFGIPLIIIIDYIAHATKTWIVPSSIFSFRLFDFVTMEVLLWAVLYTYFIIIFYEYFFDGYARKKIYKSTKYLVWILLIIIAAFFSILIVNPAYLEIPYFYLFFGTLGGLLPVALIIFRFPILLVKFFKTATYFFFVTFFYEITALRLGWWAFPGHEFVGWISLFGTRFPFEELFFWIILGAMGVLSYYEFFDDDRK